MRTLALALVCIGGLSAAMAQAPPGCQKRYCTQISTCAEAHYRYSVCGDRSLDRDDDGIPCEDMCGKSHSVMRARIAAQPLHHSQLSEASVLPQQSQAADAAPRAGDFACSGKRVCREMLTCAEARFYLTQCGVRSLDGDGDGTPCAGLCK